MIRINLLPVKEKRRRATGQRHLFVIAILVALECLAFFYVYTTRADDLARRESENKQKTAQIEKLKQEGGDIEKLQSTKRELEKQQEILDSLELGRSGPVKVLNALMRLLSPPEDARARLEIERLGGQPNWDSKRVWLRSFVEEARTGTIIGEAKSNDDVAEFLTRLSQSEFFNNVKLRWTKQHEAGDNLGNLRYVRFEVHCTVQYTGKEGGGLPAMLMAPKHGGH